MNTATSPPRSWLPYVAPMAAFLLLTSAEAWLPKLGDGVNPSWYATFYAIKIALVVAVAWACRSTWRDLRPVPNAIAIGLAITIGLIVASLWVGLDPHYPRFGLTGTRTGFDPYRLPRTARLAFLVARLFGLIAVVPLIEELFWRSFLMRWMINPEFETVPIGKVTLSAALVTSGMFALVHPEEWLPAVLTGFAWAWLLHRTKSVSACVISHAAANLALGVYVLSSGAWKFW